MIFKGVKNRFNLFVEFLGTLEYVFAAPALSVGKVRLLCCDYEFLDSGYDSAQQNEKGSLCQRSTPCDE